MKMERIGDHKVLVEINSMLNSLGPKRASILGRDIGNVREFRLRDNIIEFVGSGEKALWLPYFPYRKVRAYRLFDGSSPNPEERKFWSDVVESLGERDMIYPVYRNVNNLNMMALTGSPSIQFCGVGDIDIAVDGPAMTISFINHTVTESNVWTLRSANYDPVLMAIPNEVAAKIDIGDGNKRHEIIVGIYPRHMLPFLGAKEI